MGKICTTIEQSKKLIELGLNVDTADMYYQALGDGHYAIRPLVSGLYKFEFSLSAWSLSALLELMPPIYNLKPMIDLESNSIYYSGHDTPCTEGSTLMDAAFEMICWLLENKKL